MNLYISIKNKMNRYFNEKSSVEKSDWLFLGSLVVICCFLFYQSYDMPITIRHSQKLLELILKARPQHFYGEVYDAAMSGYYFNDPSVVHAANYSFLLYLIESIIISPLFIFENLFNISLSLSFYVFYTKIIMVFFTIASALILKKIGLKFNLGVQRSNWLAFAFISSPIILFGSTTFGQFDMISIFFLLIALLKYFNKEYYKFCGYIAIAINIKPFAVLTLLVLIILIEKRFFQIIKYLLSGVSLLLIENFIFSFSQGKAETVSGMATVYDFKGRVFASGFVTMANVSYIIVGMVIIISLAYMKKIKSDEELQVYGILFPLAMYTVFFGFILWHPQWLCIMVPFVSLATFSFANFKLNMYLEIAWGVGYILTSVLYFVNNVDTAMINQGLLSTITNVKIELSNPTFFTELFCNKFNIPISFYVSIFFGSMLMILLSKIPFQRKKLGLVDDKIEPITRGFMWGRMLVICIFLIPTFINYFSQF